LFRFVITKKGIKKLDITAFIRELLFGHDCVIVPGFGGFIGNYTPARIDKASGTFYPPVKQISFNRNLNHNDGLLIKRISASSGLNYGDARTMVEEFVSGTRRKLDKGEKVVFDRIGTFVNNQEGNVQFEPDRSVNYHLDSYGLEVFQCSPLEGYDVRKRILRHTEKIPSQHSVLRRNLWRAAVLVPVLGVMIAVSLRTDFLKSKVETSNMNPLVSAEFEHNKAEIDRTANESSLLITDSLTDSESLAEKVTESDNTAYAIEPSIPAVTVTQPVAETNSYFIITGSFRSEENAGKQAEQLKIEGLTPEVVAAGNGFYRVCAAGCPDITTAMQIKDRISPKFPGAWISAKK
jgi:nucleoid DNA-binding protein